MSHPSYQDILTGNYLDAALERDRLRRALEEIAELAAHPNSDPRIRDLVAIALEEGRSA